MQKAGSSRIRGISAASDNDETPTGSRPPQLRVDQSLTPRAGSAVPRDAAHATAARTYLESWQRLLERLQAPGAAGNVEILGAELSALISRRRGMQLDASQQAELKTVDGLCAHAFWRAMTAALPQATKDRVALGVTAPDDATQLVRLWGTDVQLARWAAGRLPQGEDGHAAVNQLACLCTHRPFPGSQPFHDLACGIAGKMAKRPGGDRVAFHILANLIGTFSLNADVLDGHPASHSMKMDAIDRLARCAAVIGDPVLRRSAVARLCTLMEGRPLELRLAIRLCRGLAQAGIGETGCRMLLSTLLRHPLWTDRRDPQPDDESLAHHAAVFSFVTDPHGDATAPDSGERFDYPDCLMPLRAALLAHGPVKGRVAQQVVIHTRLLQPHAQLVEQYAADDWDMLVNVLR